METNLLSKARNELVDIIQDKVYDCHKTNIYTHITFLDAWLACMSFLVVEGASKINSSDGERPSGLSSGSWEFSLDVRVYAFWQGTHCLQFLLRLGM